MFQKLNNLLKLLCFILFLPQFSLSKTLILNWKAEPQFGGFYAAHYPDVQILQGGSGTPTVQMLGAGKSEYAIVSAEEILIYNSKNPSSPIKALFAVYQENPQIIMCHLDLGFKNLKDVYSSGVMISMQSGLSYSLYLDKKFPKNKVKKVPYLGGLTTFLKTKSMCNQGFYTSEPITAELNGSKVKSFLISEEGFNPYTTVLAVKADYLNKNTNEVKLMFQKTKQGWESYLQHPDDTNLQMQHFNPSMSLEIFQKSAKAQQTLIQKPNIPLGSMSNDRWQTLIDQLYELGIIKERLKAVDQWIDLKL